MRVLIVDDDRGIHTMLSRLFVFEGHQVEVAQDGDEGFRSLQKQCPDLLLLDYNLPGKNGLELLLSWRVTCPELNVILITGTYDPGLEARTREAGAGFMNKPLYLPDLLAKARALQV